MTNQWQAKWKCEWCGVDVQDVEASALVPRCHRWCVIGAYDDSSFSIKDKALARNIRRRAEKQLRRDKR